MATSHSPLLTQTRGKLGNYVVYQQNGQTVLRQRNYKGAKPSQRQTAQRTVFHNARYHWQVQSGQSQAQWDALCARVPRFEEGKSPSYQSGYTLFQAVVAGRAALQLSPPDAPPQTPVLPPLLPEVTLTIVGIGYQTIRNNQVSKDFHMTVACDGYDGPVLIYTSAPRLSVPQTPPRYSLLTGLMTIPPGGVDVGALFVERFGSPRTGRVLCVQVVPISEQGFRGRGVGVHAEVQEPVPGEDGLGSPSPSLPERLGSPSPALPETGRVYEGLIPTPLPLRTGEPGRREGTGVGSARLQEGPDHEPAPAQEKPPPAPNGSGMTARLSTAVALCLAALSVSGCHAPTSPTPALPPGPHEMAAQANAVFLTQKQFDPWVLTSGPSPIPAYISDGRTGTAVTFTAKGLSEQVIRAGNYKGGQLQSTPGALRSAPPGTPYSLNMKNGTVSAFGKTLYGATQDSHNWPKLWAASDVKIDGDPEAQQVTHANLFYLLSSTYPGSRHSLPPMGLSSTVYGGHIFWDADVWMLPALLPQHPEYARSIVDYRFDRLAQAKQNAKAHGFGGAEFPWESAATGKEEAPAEFAEERHITADVAWAAWQYYLWTGDKQFLQTEGWPLLQASVDYWRTRVSKERPPAQKDPLSPNNGGTRRVSAPPEKAVTVSPAPPLLGAGGASSGAGHSSHILHVLGPDETAGPVDDDAYTIGVVRESLGAAIRAARTLGKPVPPGWQAVENGLAVPFDKGRGIPQTSAVPLTDRYAGKQADALLLLHPLHAAYDTATQGRMLDFYSAHTIKNGPAMTDSIHAIVAARLGRPQQSLDFFHSSYRPFERGPYDAFSEKRTTNNVYFLTGMAGCVQAVLYGFAGLNVASAGEAGRGTRLTGDSVASLYAAPHLPPGWTGLTVQGIRFRGRTLTLSVGPGNRVTVQKALSAPSPEATLTRHSQSLMPSSPESGRGLGTAFSAPPPPLAGEGAGG